MLILGRDRLKDPGAGYARTFLRQLEECLGLARERGVTIVANAGGLHPAGLAARVRELADRLGLPVRVAHVEGDDLTPAPGQPRRPRLPRRLRCRGLSPGGRGRGRDRPGDRRGPGHRARRRPLRLGPRGLRPPRRSGGRRARPGVRDAGDRRELRVLRRGSARPAKARLPLAELHEDGTAVITKHPGTGGFVDVGTVTAQLLYETQGARYAGPDVTARLDTVRLTQDGPDRVRISGVRGEAPPPPSRSASTASAASATRSPSS